MISFGIKDALSPYNYKAFLKKEGIALIEQIALKQELLDSLKKPYQCYKYFAANVYNYGKPAGTGIGTEQFLIENLQSLSAKMQYIKSGLHKPSTVVAPQDGTVRNSKSHKDFALEVLGKQEFEISVKLLTKGNVCMNNLLAYLRYLEGQLHTNVPF